MNYYIPVTDWPDWLMSDDYHGNDLQTPKPILPFVIFSIEIVSAL